MNKKILIVACLIIVVTFTYMVQKKKKSSFEAILNNSAFSETKTLLQESIEKTQNNIDAQKKAITSIENLLKKANQLKNQTLVDSVSSTLLSSKESLKASEDQLKILITK